MVFSSSSATPKSNNNEGWGMGLLFIFFHHHHHDHQQSSPFINDNNNNNKKRERPAFALTSSPSSNLFLSKTQSTLSICALLVFTTLLVFTLSTFEPTSNNDRGPHYGKKTSSTLSSSRRLLHEQHKTGGGVQNRFSIPGRFGPKAHIAGGGYGGAALQGMGELYLRGSKSMSDLIVGHVSEDVTTSQFRSFLRLIVHSGLLSKSDVVFVYENPALAVKFAALIKSECDSFLRLVQLNGQLGERAELGAALARYARPVGEGDKGALWGKGSEFGESTRAGKPMGENGISSELGDLTRPSRASVGLSETTRPSYGSVLGFDSSELDPEDSLSGFMDHIPMSLRRWACYPMLLGRVRRNFKHMMLVDVKGTLILSDPFSGIRNRSSETVYVWANSVPDSTDLVRHGKRKSNRAHSVDSDKDNPRRPVHAGVIVGGSRGVRRFANAALTEIVRVIIEHKGKSKNTVTESGLVNQLVRSGHLLKHINLITAIELIPDSGSLGGSNSSGFGSNFLKLSEYFSVLQRGQSATFDVDGVVMREICLSHKLFSTVYSDCLATQ